MKKTWISDNILMYTFKPLPNKFFAFNILALIQGDEILLIDAGFEFHAKEYLKDIEEMGKTVTNVIISHYHPDHVYGLREFDGYKIYGSKECDNCYLSPDKDFDKFYPDVLIESEYEFAFGDFNLKLIPLPGHDHTTIMVKINDEYLFIGDDLMTTNAGEPILPAISHKHVPRHYQSLETLKEYADLKLIPAHGLIFDNKEVTIREIKDRQIYLKNIMDSPVLLTYEEASKGCQNNYIHSEWHASMHRWE